MNITTQEHQHVYEHTRSSVPGGVCFLDVESVLLNTKKPSKHGHTNVYIQQESSIKYHDIYTQPCDMQRMTYDIILCMISHHNHEMYMVCIARNVTVWFD
jgi:hypothetical protein